MACPSRPTTTGSTSWTTSEALILETELPDECRYWQALVGDDRFCTVDWVNRQSSLNDAQAWIDTDGRFRAVISNRDPGVPNWLDKADYPWGVIQMRFYRASSYPVPTMRKVRGGRSSRSTACRYAGTSRQNSDASNCGLAVKALSSVASGEGSGRSSRMPTPLVRTSCHGVAVRADPAGHDRPVSTSTRRVRTRTSRRTTVRDDRTPDPARPQTQFGTSPPSMS